LDADDVLRPVTLSAEQISGESVVHVTMPPPDDGVASNAGPMAKTGYDAAAPVMLSVRVRGTVVVVVVVAAMVVGGAGAGGAVVVVVVVVELVVVGAAMVTVVDCGELVSVVWAFPTVSVIENDPAALSADTTPTPSANAVDVAVTVHSVDEV
jgi:hypothetical protein